MNASSSLKLLIPRNKDPLFKIFLDFYKIHFRVNLNSYCVPNKRQRLKYKVDIRCKNRSF